MRLVQKLEKKSQFWLNQADIQAILPTHELFIFTKFQIIGWKMWIFEIKCHISESFLFFPMIFDLYSRYSATRSYPITKSIQQPIRNYNSRYQQVQQKSVYKPFNQKYSVKTPTKLRPALTIPVKPPTKPTPGINWVYINL